MKERHSSAVEDARSCASRKSHSSLSDMVLGAPSAQNLAFPKHKQHSAIVADMSTEEVVDALWVLVEDLCSQRCFIEAIKCLEALCTIDAPPEKCAEVHLRLSELLIRHTYNLREAQQHAMRAQNIVSGLTGSLQLKCQIFDQLGLCHDLLGNGRSRKQWYLKGLLLCKDTEIATESELMSRWFCHFAIHLADALAKEGNQTKALAHLQEGLEVAQDKGLQDVKMVCRVFHIQILLAAFAFDNAERMLSETQALLEPPPTSISPAYEQQVTLHLLILRVLLALKQGKLKQITQDLVEDASHSVDKPRKIPRVVKRMQELIQGLPDAPFHYAFMPIAAIKTTHCLVSAVLIRAVGKLDLALAYVEEGLGIVEEQLERLGLVKGGVLHWEAGQYLVLKFLLLESKVQMLLLGCELKAAQEVLVTVLEFVDAWPTLGESLRIGGHSLAGAYLSSLGCMADSVKHFQVVSSSTVDPVQAVVGRICTALAELSEGGSDAVGRAVDALGAHYDTEDDPKLGELEKAALVFLSGLLHLQQDQVAEGKARLSRSLKIASRNGTSEVMCYALNKLSMLHLTSADLDGAQKMITSSYTLSKQVNNLVALLGGLEVMEKLYVTNRLEEKRESMKNYREQKELALREEMRKTKEDEERHMWIRDWGIGGVP